jgi:hypothetical protein
MQAIRKNKMPKTAAWMAVLAIGVCICVCSTALAQAGQPLYGAHGVSPQAVRQGVLGSCYFHATIAAIAQASPETLRHDLSTNPGGGYRVRFVQGPQEVVFPEDVEFGRAHSYDRSDGVWVAVLMRGYAQRVLRRSLVKAIETSTYIPVFVRPMALQWLDQSDLLLVAYDRAVRAVVSQDGNLDKSALKAKLTAQLSALGIPGSETAILTGFLDDQGFFDVLAQTVEKNGEVFGAYKSLGQGGIPQNVMEAFLGAAGGGAVSDRRALMDQLRRVHRGSLAMVAGTGTNGPYLAHPTPTTAWFVPEHAYTVLDFDEASQTVSLRNPWGARPDPDGSFSLPLDMFLRTFDSYSVSSARGQ